MVDFVLGESVSIQNVVIRVKNRDKMIDFYRHLIGFKLLGEENALAFMGTGDKKNDCLWLEESPRANDHFGEVKKMHHFTIAVPKVAELAEVYARLQQETYPVAIDFSKKVIRLQLTDPEENQLEIIANQENHLVEDEAQLLKQLPEQRLGLSEQAYIESIHLNVTDLEEMKQFFEQSFGEMIQDEKVFELKNERPFHVTVREAIGEQITTESHEIIGLDFLKFKITSEQLSQLEARFKATKQEYFVDQKKSILTIYDKVGVEWWFTVK